MSEVENVDKVFSGSIPQLYDTHLVPLIFEPYANDLAARVAALAPAAVLEIAAGTGVVTRAVAPVLGRDCRYTVTDLNQPMLDHAAARQPADDRITWRQADALALPFDDGRIGCPLPGAAASIGTAWPPWASASYLAVPPLTTLP